MEVRIIIVSLACLCCLVPPALGTGLVAKAAVIGAAKGALVGGIKGAAVGAGVGLAAKGAAALVTKKALLSIALKAAALKGGAILKAKKAALSGLGSLAKKGLGGLSTVTGLISALTRQSSDCEPTISRSPLMDILTGTAAVVRSFQPCRFAARIETPTVYRILTAPRIVAVRLPTKEEMSGA